MMVMKKKDTPQPVLPCTDASSGDTKEEAIGNIKEAIELYLRAVANEQLPCKEKARKLETVEVAV
jgi:predicted RNase H-like HicB family nuclease